MKIGFRTVKTAVGVSLSILLSQGLGLTYFTSAGILTLLCIQKTRKESFRAVLDRFFACLIGLFLSSAIFTLLGYHAVLFLPLFMALIPLCVSLKVQGGIASSSVIIMHTYLHEKVDISFIVNELAVIAIGLGVALIVNVYMPGLDKQIARYRGEIEANIAIVLHEFAKYLKEGYGLWDGREMLILTDLLRQARGVAMQELENHLVRKADLYFYEYETQRQQVQILERMLPLVSRVDIRLEQGVRIGDFMEELSLHIHSLPERPEFLERLRDIREYHKRLPMPQHRNEFENRANLYTLANELEQFVRMAQRRP